MVVSVEAAADFAFDLDADFLVFLIGLPLWIDKQGVVPLRESFRIVHGVYEVRNVKLEDWALALELLACFSLKFVYLNENNIKLAWSRAFVHVGNQDFDFLVLFVEVGIFCEIELEECLRRSFLVVLEQ